MIVDSTTSFVGCIFNSLLDFSLVGGFDTAHAAARYFLDYSSQLYTSGLGFVHEWDKESFFFFF